MYKISIADEDPERILKTELLLKNFKMQVISKHTNGIGCLDALLSHIPEIVILDVNIGNMSGLEILSIVKFQNLPIKVILLVQQEELSIYFRAKESGFDGFLLKENLEQEMQTCINQVMKGNTYLSKDLTEYFA